MDKREKNVFFGLKAALTGIVDATKSERNLKIHWMALVFMVCFGLYFDLHKEDWFAVIIASCLVLITELINTAIEKAMDLLHPSYSEKVRFIKDVSAGAVLLSAFAAIVIFGIIIWDKVH
jgi:diacylglycerol kinase